MARHLHMSSAEYEAHDRTYHMFTHLTLWFTLHAGVIVAGVLFLIFGMLAAGVLFIAAGIGILGYGIISGPRAARNASHRNPEGAETGVVAEQPHAQREDHETFRSSDPLTSVRPDESRADKTEL